MPSPVLKEALPFTAEVDPEKLRDELCERFPLWSQQIRLLSIEESLAARPTDNDGHVLYLNSRILRYFTPEIILPVSFSICSSVTMPAVVTKSGVSGAWRPRR